MKNLRSRLQELPVTLPALLVGAALLILGLLAIDRLTYTALTWTLSHSNYRYLEFYNEADPRVDLVVIGDSRAGTHFPRTGYDALKILNLGRGGTGFPLLAAQAKDYVDLHGPVDAIVVESWFLGSSAWGGDHGAIQSVYSERVDALVDSESSTLGRLSRKFVATTRLNENNFLNGLAGVFVESFDSSPPSNRAITQAMKDRLLSQDNQVAMTSRNRVELVNLVSHMNRLGVRVIVVTTPMHPLAVESFQGIDEFVRQIDEISAQPGVEHLNYLALFEEDAFFADPVHLNRIGKTSFSEIFFGNLEQEGQRSE